ncbi:hypothetical protein GPJ56_007218 [Histomonas meleagridis]|nr:hypothetical protein GPJ56_007218 [Histomonas meleagridis]
MHQAGGNPGSVEQCMCSRHDPGSSETPGAGGEHPGVVEAQVRAAQVVRLSRWREPRCGGAQCVEHSGGQAPRQTQAVAPTGVVEHSGAGGGSVWRHCGVALSVWHWWW